MWTVKFWKNVAERVLFTFVETLLGLISANAVTPLDVDWKFVLLASAMAALAALLKGIVAGFVGDPTSGSMLGSG